VKLTTFALWIAGASSLFAQSTWGDLKFGMTVKEVSETFNGKTTSMNQNSDEVPVLSLDPILVGNERGIARFVFEKNQKLSRVALDFSDGHTEHAGCFATPENDVKRIRRVEVIGNGLVARYGKPASESGNPWPSADRLIRYFTRKELDQIDSKRIWRDSGQVIEANVTVICGQLFLTVDYHPVGSEL
jgi:hypothetical protein